MTATQSYDSPIEDRRRTRRVATVIAVVFAALAGTAAVTSRGFLEADGCTHYLYARFALAEPHYLVNVWGRPVKTILYALPAHYGGLVGVRFMSIALALLTAWLTLLIARRQGYRRPELAAMFLLGMPLFFLHGFSELTELPFAFLVALAMLAYQRKAWPELALVAGLMPLARPEGFGLLPLVGLALVLHRKYLVLPILFIPLIAWNHAGWVMFGRQGEWARWIIDHWPYAGDSVYQAGPPWKFLAVLPMLVSPILLPFTWLGMGRGLREKSVIADHRARCQFVIAVLPLLVLVGHTGLYVLGKMASNGELRYLLCVAPLWALNSAAGWEYFCERFGLRSRSSLATVAVLLPIGANLIYPVVPLKFDTNWQDAEAVAFELHDDLSRQPNVKLMMSHPGLYYFLDLSITDRERSLEWGNTVVEQKPPGVLLVWDDIYGLFNADRAKVVKLEDIRAAGWRELPVTGLQQPERWHVFSSE